MAALSAQESQWPQLERAFTLADAVARLEVAHADAARCAALFGVSSYVT